MLKRLRSQELVHQGHEVRELWIRARSRSGKISVVVPLLGLGSPV